MSELPRGSTRGEPPVQSRFDSEFGQADQVAIDAPEGVLTYAELDAQIDGLCLALLAEGVSAGARVALLLENGVPLIIAIHAVARADAVVAPLSPRLTADELAAALRVLEPAALVYSRETEGVARGAVQQLGATNEPLGGGTRLLDAEELLGDASPREELADPIQSQSSNEIGYRPPWYALYARESELAILWTSGTSGRPRGVALTGQNLMWSARAAKDRLDLGPDDRWYLGLSCAHVGGLALVTRAFILGSTVVVRGKFSAAAFNELVDSGRVTHASLVPTMLVQALEQRADRPPPASLRCVLTGGAHTPRDLVDRALDAGFPVWLTYGMTEATSQVATAPPDLVRKKPGTVGAALMGVDVRTRHGEILVRGDTVAVRYLGVDEPLVDEEGWLHTGDLGEIDEDGHLFVTGRLTDRIISAGVNVDPLEVEQVLRRHSYVHDVAVVAVEDAVWGEVVAALIVLNPELATAVYPSIVLTAENDAPFLGEEISRFARAKLSSTKVPRRFVFTTEIPRNANGKVDRGAVRKLLAEG